MGNEHNMEAALTALIERLRSEEMDEERVQRVFQEKVDEAIQRTLDALARAEFAWDDERALAQLAIDILSATQDVLTALGTKGCRCA